MCTGCSASVHVWAARGVGAKASVRLRWLRWWSVSRRRAGWGETSTAKRESHGTACPAFTVPSRQ
eukprot:364298-Chlamydomonas_euryale.AAC.1